MVFKRKDKKGRNLRSGECQCKEGRYQFEYTDLDEKQRPVNCRKMHPIYRKFTGNDGKNT